MLFIVNALLYYGLILFAIRKISKEETKIIDLNAGTTVPNQKDGRLRNNFIRDETRVLDLIAGTTVLIIMRKMLSYATKLSDGIDLCL